MTRFYDICKTNAALRFKINWTMIRIKTRRCQRDLYGKSKWWGEPDLPEDMDYPYVRIEEEDQEYADPMTFICQIRCEDLKPFDSEGRLPHNGMLWFFATIDYYLGDIDSAVYAGMGEWDKNNFKVLYSPDAENLVTHSIRYEDGTPAGLEAEEIIFEEGESADGTRLLGSPFFEEVRQEMPDMVSLLQIDENDDWRLIFHDCGMLNFLIRQEDLASRDFDRTACYLHSF